MDLELLLSPLSMVSPLDPNVDPNAPTLSGYSLVENLHQSVKTTVYRALSEGQHQPVVIKFLRPDYPRFDELVQFRNQYQITKNLAVPGIVAPLSLEPWRNGYALVMEDCGAVDLGQYAKTHALSWQDVFKIALQLAETLHQLGQHRIIHKDIKPANILIHPGTQEARLIDFGIASMLPRESQDIQSPSDLEGTLAYLAPEQTGRMNRGVDYRSDFYSLGVTLYELLTGQLPFRSEDPMELVHCHIAQTPVPAHEVNGKIPEPVSAIVMKLMAKNAEERYQSALGLKHDVAHCLRQWDDHRQMSTFDLGQEDRCDRFLIPEKLYGREAEVSMLLTAFDRVAQGASEVMLVAGFSGIGKTAIVNEIHKPITQRHGYFIRGKFDQFNRSIPFSAFVQAFRSLVGQLLGEPDTAVEDWKRRILAAVGETAQVLIEVIPELELILGTQPSVPELAGTAAQNRFNLIFGKFIQVFTTLEHPLVIFLDDLQWVDAASLTLLKLLMEGTEFGHLLVLGAYRDNEVFPAHPMVLMLEELKKQAVSVQTLTLEPLGQDDIAKLVADTLNCDCLLSMPLADLIYQKTQGNPFFTTQFLQGLHDDGYIKFDADLRHWQCELTQLKQLTLTDDVVAFMVERLQKLSTANQEVLKNAACIGNRFTLSTLVVISEAAEETIASDLWPALQLGLIIPEAETYKFFQGSSSCEIPQEQVQVVYRFLHDRVQQACYALIPEAQKRNRHWEIGQLLLQKNLSQSQEDNLFEVVNHLNYACATDLSETEKHQLAELNLRVGIKAKRSAAHQAAYGYCDWGIQLLSDGGWQEHYDLMYRLHYQGAEAAYLCGSFEQAELLYEAASNQANCAVEKAAIHRLQMTQYQLQGRNREAIAIQRKSLQLLGWDVPDSAAMVRVELEAEIAAVDEFLSQHPIDEILELPQAENASIIEMLRIIQILFYAAWLDGQPELALLACAKMTTLSLKHGNSEMSPFGYVGYGMLAVGLLEKFDIAYQFGKMAVQLCEQFDEPDIRGVTNFVFASDVQSWTRPILEANAYYEQAYVYSMQAGNWLTVSFIMMLSGSDRLTAGENLPQLLDCVQGYAEFLSQIKSFDNRDALVAGVLQPIRQLLGLTHNNQSFDDDSFSEAEYLEKYQANPFHLSWLYSVKIRHAYLLEQKDSYSDLIPKLRLIETTVASHAKVPSSVFYVALMYLSLLEDLIHTGTEASIQQHWDDVQTLENRLEHWSQSCPTNIHHKLILVRAEKARLQHNRSLAIELYDQAVLHAQQQDYIYEQALANELAARFYLAWGKEKVAASYLQDAYYCYERWGATVKTDQLELVYPQLLQLKTQQRDNGLLPLQTINNASQSSSHFSTQSSQRSNYSLLDALDLNTVIQSAQLLSSKLDLDCLIAQLMQLMLQTSGAETCALVLPPVEMKQSVSEQTVAQNDGVTQNDWLVYRLVLSSSLEDSSDSANANLLTLATPERCAVASNIPSSLIHYVKRTENAVQIDNLEHQEIDITDAYLLDQNPRSVLVQPIFHQEKIVGVLYLENRTTAHVFNPNRRVVIDFFCNQAGIALENASLYKQQAHQAQVLQLKNQELQVAKKTAEAANEAKSHFLKNMTHELRTPLNGVLGYAQILQRSEDLSEQDKERVEIIHQSGTRLLSLVEDVIEVTRIEAHNLDLMPSEVNLLALLKEVMGLVQSQADFKELRLDYRPDSELPEWIVVDGKRLKQVLLNLLSNGIKFTEAGSVCLQVELVAMQNSNVSLKFSVSDTGIGIAEQEQTTLFQVFRQVKNSQNRAAGLGLSLAMSQRIINHMGSSIELESQLGKGSQFYFVLELPLCVTTSRQRLMDSEVMMLEPLNEQAIANQLFDDLATSQSVVGQPIAEVIVPCEAELQALLNLSRAGRLNKLRKQLKNLVDRDVRYSGFANPLLLLEKQFKVHELEDLLEQYLQEPGNFAT